MSVQMSNIVRNARLEAIESAIGTAAKLRLYTGAAPANCAAAETGTLRVEFALAADWAAAAAAAGVKSFNSLPLLVAAAASGTAAHFRIYDSAGSTAHDQGAVTPSGGGGDMTLDNTNIATSQIVTVTSFPITEGHA